MRNVAGYGDPRKMLAALALFALAACGSADKATKALGAGPGVGETTVSMPFELNVAGGAAPTAVQADLKFDATRYRVQGVKSGEAVTRVVDASGNPLKSFSNSLVEDGTLRLVVYGGTAPLESGNLATIDFVDNSGSGRNPVITVQGAKAVDASASVLNTTASGSGMEVRR